jgi:hypothetical protein
MGRRIALVLVVLATALAGCAGADTTAGTAAEVASDGTATASCEELADELVAQLQVIVDGLSNLQLEELGQEDVLPADFQQQLDDLTGRIETSDCSDEEMRALLAERADQIQGDSPIADAVRDSLKAGEDLPF